MVAAAASGFRKFRPHLNEARRYNFAEFYSEHIDRTKEGFRRVNPSSSEVEITHSAAIVLAVEFHKAAVSTARRKQAAGVISLMAGVAGFIFGQKYSNDKARSMTVITAGAIGFAGLGVIGLSLLTKYRIANQVVKSKPKLDSHAHEFEGGMPLISNYGELDEGAPGCKSTYQQASNNLNRTLRYMTAGL